MIYYNSSKEVLFLFFKFHVPFSPFWWVSRKGPTSQRENSCNPSLRISVMPVSKPLCNAIILYCIEQASWCNAQMWPEKYIHIQIPPYGLHRSHVMQYHCGYCKLGVPLGVLCSYCLHSSSYHSSYKIPSTWHSHCGTVPYKKTYIAGQEERSQRSTWQCSL